MDWWIPGSGGGTPGNLILMKINARLIQWMKKEMDIEAAEKIMI